MLKSRQEHDVQELHNRRYRKNGPQLVDNGPCLTLSVHSAGYRLRDPKLGTTQRGVAKVGVATTLIRGIKIDTRNLLWNSGLWRSCGRLPRRAQIIMSARASVPCSMRRATLTANVDPIRPVRPNTSSALLEPNEQTTRGYNDTTVITNDVVTHLT